MTHTMLNWKTREAQAHVWDGSLVPPGVDGYAPDQTDWGTYTFEICVARYDTENSIQPADTFYLKWPYCLQDGSHNVWTVDKDDGTKDLRCSYTLTDFAAAHNYSNAQPVVSVNLTAVDSALNEVSHISGETGISVPYGAPDGITVANDPELDGIWRVIFTGEDGCWKEYRRDHQNSRMLAFNKTSVPNAAYYVDFIRAVRRLEALQFCAYEVGWPFYYWRYKAISTPLEALEVLRGIQNVYVDDSSDLPFGKWRLVCGPLPNEGPIPKRFVYGQGSDGQRESAWVWSFFNHCKTVCVPKNTHTNQCTAMDAPHFVATLSGQVYDHGALPASANGILWDLYYEDYQIDELIGWAGDLQTGANDLNTVMIESRSSPHNRYEMGEYACQIVGARCVVPNLVDKHTGKWTVGSFSHNDMYADIDAYNIGCEFIGHANSFKLSDALSTYWQGASAESPPIGAKRRFNSFRSLMTGHGGLEQRVHFMVNLFPSWDVDNPTLYDHALLTRGLTQEQRDAMQKAFTDYVVNEATHEN